ncbi:MAG: sigma-70 family RNA polymerase sigma factor [Gemmataceae bacterium]
MENTSLRTTQLQLYVQRMQAGDLKARDELLLGVCRRMEHLARKMFRGFPRLGRLVETNDVLQNALMRLLRALQELQPASMREFFGLAALQIRRELHDLTRHFLGPEGMGKRHVTPEESGFLDNVPEAEKDETPDELEKWGRFHQAVEDLPVEEREVVGLLFYHGWTQQEVADLFVESERTIRRRWRDARVRLHERLKDLEIGGGRWRDRG